MGQPLPESLATLFWDHPGGGVSWEEHREFVIDRVLSHGSWDAIRWVRARAADDELRAVIQRTRGRRLSRRQLRFWQLVLDLPDGDVDEWLRAPERTLWDGRTR